MRDEAASLEGRANVGRVLAALKEEGQVHEYLAWKDVLFYRGIERTSSSMLGIQEVLAVTPAIKDMIVQSASAEELEAEARTEGMLTLDEDALFKAVQGLVSIEEVLDN